MLGISFHPHYKLKQNRWFTNTGKCWIIETPFSRFVKRAVKLSLNRMWRHFSLDDAYTKISGVFCPAPGTALSRVSHGVSSFSLPHLHGARGMGTNKQFVGALLMESLHFHNVTCKLSWFWRYLSLQLESIAVPFLIIHQVTFFARIFTDFVGSVAFCLLRSNSIKYCVDVLTS